MFAIIRYLAMAALGASAAYFLDPARGRSRRIVLRDKVAKMGKKSAVAMEKSLVNTRNRVKGRILEQVHAAQEEFVSDEILKERVRAKIGHVARDPHTVYVSAEDGRIVLTGRARPHEIRKIVQAVKQVRGVAEVEDRFTTQGPPMQGHAQSHFGTTARG